MVAVRVQQLYPEKIPQELRQHNQWVCWKYEQHKNEKEPRKVPVNPKTGSNASTASPGTWGTFEQALTNYQKYKTLAGIGFVFNNNGIAGIDLDKCRDPETGVVDEWAEDIIFSLDSYTEISPSGTGFHIFVKTHHRDIGSNNRKAKVELYTTGRYFTVTGDLYG